MKRAIKLINDKIEKMEDEYFAEDILIQAGDNQYKAKTVVGITDGGEYVFYDVVDMEPTSFKLNEEPSTAAAGKKAESAIQESSSGDSVTGSDIHVKQKFSFDDEDYLLAVEAGDMDAAQEMVDEAAKAAGHTIRAYHGTTQEFNVFNGGAFFTDDYFNADGYAEGERVIDAFLKIENPLFIDAKGAKWDELNTEYGETTREIVRRADNGNYDGVIFEDIADSWIDDEDGGTFTVYYPFKNDQIKYADTVTYNDNGNIIPLSERFNSENADMRYSIDEEFEADIDQWEEDGRPEGESFILGSTGDVLQGLAAIESDIYIFLLICQQEQIKILFFVFCNFYNSHQSHLQIPIC